jgi:hypothetical protein
MSIKSLHVRHTAIKRQGRKASWPYLVFGAWAIQSRSSCRKRTIPKDLRKVVGIEWIGARPATLPKTDWCKQWACVTDLVAGGGDLEDIGGGACFVSEDLHAVIKGAAERELGGASGGGGGGGSSSSTSATI